MRSRMTYPSQHCIQRQLIELTVGEGLRAPALLERMARCYWERMVGELEAVFDRVAGPDKMLRLERLCLEQAEEAGMPEGKAALLSMAADYRAAAERVPRAAA